MPAMFRPLQELENEAPGTWYVNVLAVVPEQRRRGVGTALLRQAETSAAASGHRGISIIVSDANIEARRLYKVCGYSEGAARPMIKEGWQNAGKNWILLTKSLR
jgi:ribosomal protein S18 acetylase RimI-like enzyme